MKITSIIMILLASSSLLFGQSSAEILAMKSAVPQATKKVNYQDLNKNSNELEYIFSGLFILYKSFLSSQDGYTCSFTPSCSEYGLQSVKRRGAFIGMLATFDRLTRCNGFSPEKYHIDRESLKFYDPVN